MCSNGDFAITSDGNGHQALGAKAINPKTNDCVFGKIFLFFFFFSPLCNSLTAVEFHNLAKFHQKKKPLIVFIAIPNNQRTSIFWFFEKSNKKKTPFFPVTTISKTSKNQQFS